MKKLTRILTMVMVVMGVGIAGYFGQKGDWQGKNDFRVGLANNEGLSMISVSPSRRMINGLRVKGETMVWIPGGMGWYQSSKIEKIIRQEKDDSLLEKLMFYNFGFLPDRVIVGGNDWNKRSGLISSLGVTGWLRYEIIKGDLFYKEETIEVSDVGKVETEVDEVAARDFADNQILETDDRLKIYNCSKQDGLAGFLAKRLEWSGFTVMSIENSEAEVKKCRVTSGNDSRELQRLGRLANWWGCSWDQDLDLGENEVELYLGEELGEVIKYLSYKQVQ
jgi:hypothetical protein